MFIFAFNNLKSNTYEIWRPDASYKSILIKYVARERYLLSISAFIIYEIIMHFVHINKFNNGLVA